MGRKEAFAKAKTVQDTLTAMWERFVFNFAFDHTVDEVMDLRGYESREMRQTLSEIKIFKTMSTAETASEFESKVSLLDLGLVSEQGTHLLNGRYVIPIRSLTGKVIALVGWYPDAKRYITTKTFGFTKSTTFFNLEHALPLAWSKFNGVVFLVEGMFDTLALRSLGLPVIGNMGVVLSNPKRELLRFFKHVVVISDGDATGYSYLPTGNKAWNYPATYVKLIGVKDSDDLVKGYTQVKESLLSVLHEKRSLIKWDFR